MNKTTPEALFADFETTAAEHFRLHFFGAVLVCIEHAAACAESFETALERFPFLAGYNNELAERLAGLSLYEAFARWCAALEAWEVRAAGHLPLRALRKSLGVDMAGIMCLFSVGLVEEDARFGVLFETLQGLPGQRRPLAGLLRQCWREHLSGNDLSRLLRHARAAGVIVAAEADGAQHDPALRIPPGMWEALRGDTIGTPLPWAHWREADSLAPIGDLIATPEIRSALAALPRLFASGEARVVILRGARHNGRRTLLGALARSMGRGVLELRGAEKFDEARWREAATLAGLQNALPVASADLGPGETLTLPEAWPPGMPLAFVLGRQGGVAGGLAADALTLTLDLPDLESRRAHWREADSLAPIGDLIATPEIRSALAALPRLFASGEARV
ncbi:hypothetical protein EON77_14915, partial [bacterium]